MGGALRELGSTGRWPTLSSGSQSGLWLSRWSLLKLGAGTGQQRDGKTGDIVGQH